MRSTPNAPQVGRVLFMRMYEGEAAFAGRQYAGADEDRLEAVIQVR